MAEVERINRRLNLVIPIFDPDDAQTKEPIAWAYHIAITQDVFRTYWKVIAQTMQSLLTGGVGLYGPRYACYQMKDIAVADRTWEDRKVGDDTIVGVKNGLYNELIRRTQIALASKNGGWEQMLLSDVKSGRLLSEDQIDEVEGAVTFFTVGSRSQSQGKQDQILAGLIMWNAAPTSSSFSEFMNSLRTSKKKENTGETPTV